MRPRWKRNCAKNPPKDAEQLRAALEGIRKERASEIAWIRVIERQVEPRGPAPVTLRAPAAVALAASGGLQNEPELPPADVLKRFEGGARSVIEDERFGPRSRSVVVAVPVRFPYGPDLPPAEVRPPGTENGSAGARDGTRPSAWPALGQAGGLAPASPVRRAGMVGTSGEAARVPAGIGSASPRAGDRGTRSLAVTAGTEDRGARSAQTGARPGALAPRSDDRPRRPRRPAMRVAEIGLYLRGSADPFAPLRRDMIVAIAAAVALLAAVMLLFVRLPAYLRGRELEQQVSVARQVQQELFPDATTATEGLDFSAQCVPIWEVGGDYYDVFSTGGGETALVLGDVSGKGLPAALLMALIHGAVRSGPNGPEDDHARAVGELNRMLYSRLPGDRFVSLFWAYYSPDSCTLRYVNAGHPPPLLFERAAEGRTPTPASVRALQEGGPVLGVLRGASYQSESLCLGEEHLLVVYSDGLSEAENSAGEEFGVQRLRVVIEQNLDRPAAEIRQALVDEVRLFTGSQPLHDDLTLLVVRFLGAARAAAIAAAD